MSKNHISFKQAILGGAAIFILLLILTLIFPGVSKNNKLVVYCAHDAIFSEKIIKRFEEKTGIAVELKTDTEATKSLGLVNLLIREKDHPRCDVFWNNQLLGTLELQKEGVLDTYSGKELERFPEQFKAPDGSWVGFAARLRVYIINTEKMDPEFQEIEKKFENELEQVAVAKPMYGTTLTHYSLLWNEWGAEKLKQWHEDVREKGIRELSGNSMVKNIVAEGTCSVGWTDTDDFFIAKDDGYPVTMLPVLTGSEKTICIPNTVSIIKGSRNRELAEKFMDFLLSEEVEILLANSPSRQIPLGKLKKPESVPDDVQELINYGQLGVSLDGLLESRMECLEWLRSEYLE